MTLAKAFGRGWGHIVAIVGALLFAFLAGPLPALAQPSAQPPMVKDFAYDRWTTNEGLPHNSVQNIVQTREGYLWLATWEGLARYNGTRFTTFSRDSNPPLPDNGVTSILSDRQGNLWMGDTRGNLGRRDSAGRWRFWGARNGLPHATILALAQDSKGRLWIGFMRGGLGMLSPDGRFRRLDSPAGGPPLSILGLAIDAQDRLWIGGVDGLVERTPDGRMRRLSKPFGLPAGAVLPFVDQRKQLFLLASGELRQVQGDTARLIYRLPGTNRFSAMTADRWGGLWLGTENLGVLHLARGQSEWITPTQGLPEGRVASVFQDREGSIWVGLNGGLYRLRQALFTNLRQENGLSGNYVRALVESGDRSLWVGSSRGLDHVAPDGRITHIPIVQAGVSGDNSPSVLSLLAQPDGDVWVGTLGDGIFRVHDNRIVARYGKAEGIRDIRIRTLAARRGGGLWAGTRRGVVAIDGQGQVRQPMLPGLPKTMIYAIADTRHGLWIGTISDLTLWPPNGIPRRIDIGKMADASSALALFEDPDQSVMWISTDRGLFRYRYADGQLAHVGRDQGLPVDTVFQMVLDRRGAAWLGSNSGVLRIDYAALMAVADGKRRTIRVDRFDRLDGMASAQGNGASGPTTLLRRDGSIWFATAEGAAAVRPEREAQLRVRTPPPLVIEGVSVDGEPAPFADNAGWVSIPAKTRRVSIAYGGLSFLSPQSIRYRTRLVGYENDWIDRGGERIVDYTALPPGRYALHVSASNGGGPWSARDQVLRFVIEPSFWQRSDFRLALVVLLVGLAGLAYRWRVVNLHRRARHLSLLIEERTADIRRQGEMLMLATEEKDALFAQLANQARTLRRMAHEDALTELPNRRRYEDELAEQLASYAEHGRPWSLAILDIDHFKRINDRHSHAVGDATLRRVAAVMRDSVRDGDLVARLGGEEFALLMPDADAAEARMVCERVRGAIEAARYDACAPGLRVTISIGVATWPGYRSPSAMQAAADAALYRAKENGRNRVMASDTPQSAQLDVVG